jgi:hypothetical protein
MHAIFTAPEFSRDEVIFAARELHDAGLQVTPKRLFDTYGIVDGDYTEHFGGIAGLKRAAEVSPSRVVQQMKTKLVQWSDHERYARMEQERNAIVGLYEPSTNLKEGRHDILVCADVHDIKVDPFWLRVFLETVEDTKSFVGTIVLLGDIWDAHDLSNHTKKPSDYNLASSISFVHNFIAAIRRSNPEAHIVFVEGNHEYRLIRLLAEVNQVYGNVIDMVRQIHSIGPTVGDILGVHRYGVTYCSRADLRKFNKSEVNREICNRNWWAFRDMVKFNHYPERNPTCAGVNGHHHKFHVRDGYHSLTIGAFQWMQIGCGSRKSEDYIDAERWVNGFGHVSVDFAAIDKVQLSHYTVTDSARVFGRLYVRDHTKDMAVYETICKPAER